ncbi:MAG: hypothetical protein ACFFDT_30065 [Candidatus Hodarchaeota archaeon]
MQIILTIILAIIGGLLTFGIIELIKYIFSRIRLRHLRKFFGEDVVSSDAFHLVYAEFILPKFINNNQLPSHPFKKPGKEKSGIGFSMHNPISSCEVRSIKYLVESLFPQKGDKLMLSSDTELSKQLNISFVAFGDPLSNYKTKDIMQNEGTELIGFDNIKFYSVKSNQVVLIPDGQYDYGIILKIHPKQFSERTWFACAGLDEWGTSGAAWYLAKKWKSLYNFAKDSPFAVIVRVNKGQDESAKIVLKAKNQDDIDKYINKV